MGPGSMQATASNCARGLHAGGRRLLTVRSLAALYRCPCLPVITPSTRSEWRRLAAQLSCRRGDRAARSGLTVGQFLQVLAQGCVDFLLVVAHPEPGGGEPGLLDVAGRDRPVRRHATAQRSLDPGDELVDLGDLVSGS